MELAPAAVPLSFEVTYDSDSLFVGMAVYDDSGSTPALIQGPGAMALVAGNTYRGKFTGENGKSYIIIKSVYTDNTYTEIDDNYAAGSESIVVQNLGSGGSSGNCDVVGLVDDTDAVIGIVDC